MSRIRTVKPELFLDEDLGVMPADAVLLFIGLLTLADREGRVEDRPVRIKACLFPYREVDVSELIATLERSGKVIRYEAEGRRCLLVPGFVAHQRPHPKESRSKLPEPPSREKVGDHPVESRGEGKGREGDLGREGKELSEKHEITHLYPDQAPTDAHRADPTAEAQALLRHVTTRRAAFGALCDVPGVVPLTAWWMATAKELTARGTSPPGPAVQLAYDAFLRDPFWAPKQWPWGAFAAKVHGYVGRTTQSRHRVNGKRASDGL